MRTVVASILTLCVAFLVFYLARFFSPWPVVGTDGEFAAIHKAAIAHELSKDPSATGEVFLSADGQDLDAATLAQLSKVNGQLVLRPLSQAPRPSCPATDNYVPVGPCEQYESLRSTIAAMPLWHVALVHTRTRACWSEHVLVNVSAAWNVFSSKTACS